MKSKRAARQGRPLCSQSQHHYTTNTRDCQPPLCIQNGYIDMTGTDGAPANDR